MKIISRGSSQAHAGSGEWHMVARQTDDRPHARAEHNMESAPLTATRHPAFTSAQDSVSEIAAFENLYRQPIPGARRRNANDRSANAFQEE